MVLAGRRSSALTVSILAVFWSLICSLAAAFMIFIWGFTDHAAGYRNENLFQFSPVSFVILIYALRGFRWKHADKLVLLALAISMLGVILQIVPMFRQMNLEMMALALPAHAGLAAGVWMLQNRPVAAKATPAAAKEPSKGSKR